jgi:hypothetical protein
MKKHPVTNAALIALLAVIVPTVANTGPATKAPRVRVTTDTRVHEGVEETPRSGKLNASDPQLRPQNAELTLAEALRLANSAASQSTRFKNLEAVAFDYSCNGNNECSWNFVYTGVPRLIDGRRSQLSITLGVRVNDQTKDTELVVPHFIDHQ